MRGRTQAAGSFVALACVFLLAIACDPGESVYFENRTGQIIDVYQGDYFLFTLKPDEVSSVGAIDRESEWPSQILAYDHDGSVVFDRTFALEEARAVDYHIVIE